MEFPHLGKHCSENSCNKLGKLWWWHARIYMYKSICAICVRLYMMCMWNVPFWAKRMTTVTVQTNTAYPNRKKRKKTQCVLPQCMRIPNIYSLYVVTKSCCSHLYKKKKKYRNIVFHSLHAKIKLWYWTWNKIRKTHMNNGIGWSYQQFVHAGFHMAYADACDACGSSTIHKMLHTYNVGEGSMIQMNVLFHSDMNCV